MITFTFKPEKFASSVAYLVENKPGLTKKQICKLIFLADKKHLLQYGRTITGDRYYALEQGPIPSHGLNAINGKGPYAEAVRKYGHLQGWVFKLDEKPNLRPLSKSDRRILDEIMAEFGNRPAWKLERITHEDPAWQQADQNGPMDFEKFFEGHPESDLLKKILLEEATA